MVERLGRLRCLRIAAAMGAIVLSACSYRSATLDQAAPSIPPAPLASAATNDVSVPPLAARKARPQVSAAPQKPAHEEQPGAAEALGPRTIDRPLVTIQFNRPDVDYAQPLYEAVSQALQRKPSATFTVEGVAPAAATPDQLAANTNTCRQNAESVLEALTQMGMPADRLTLAAIMTPQASSDEVRIYVH